MSYLGQKPTLDIDLLTIDQKGKHVITATIFMDEILFFSIENDFRLHYQCLSENSKLQPCAPPLFSANIIQLQASNDAIFVLTQRQFLIYHPFKNKTTHLCTLVTKPDTQGQVFLKFAYYARDGVQFLVALSVSLDISYLSFYFIQQQVFTLTPYSIGDFIITDFEIEALQLTQDGFLESFNMLIARAKQSVLSCTGKVVGQAGQTITTRIDLNGINEQCNFFIRADSDFIALTQENAGYCVTTFYRFGLWGRADFMNEKVCKLDFGGHLAYIQLYDDFVAAVSKEADFYLIHKNDFLDEFVEFKMQLNRKIKRVETICAEIRRLRGRLLWAGFVYKVFVIVVSGDEQEEQRKSGV